MNNGCLEENLRNFDFSVFSKVRETLLANLLALHRKRQHLYFDKTIDDDELNLAAGGVKFPTLKRTDNE